MDDPTSGQCIETSMEYMKFCVHVIEKEMLKFNLDFNMYKIFLAQLPGVLDVNFDIAYNRCAFMYKYTLCNIYFFKDCMKKFMLECPEFENLVSKWVADSNIRLCSLSCGPGLDYLSFMLALSDHVTPPSFKSVTILPKHGAWRNTVSIVADSLEEGSLSKFGIQKLTNFKNIEVVQANLPLSVPAKNMEALQQSSIILMVKTLNLTAPGTNDEIIKANLMELFSSIKPETTVFFIDTKPSLALFLEVLPKFDGKFLCKPEHLSFRVPITFSEEYKEKHGCWPVVSSRGAFFVWQKLSSFKPDTTINISPLNPLIDLKDISQNSLNWNDDVSNLTKDLNDLMLWSNKNLQLNLVGDVPGVSQINGRHGKSVSATSSPVHTPEKFELNSSHVLLTSQSFQELSPVNFDEKSLSSKRSSSNDNGFLQSSSKNILFGESSLLQNSLYSNTIQETHPTSLPQSNVTKKKISENNVPKRNPAIRSTSESKATQTDPQFASSSNLVKGLTERVKRLVSSLENEVQKNIPADQVNQPVHASPNRSAHFSSCSTNSSNPSDADVKPPCCNDFQIGRVSCCHQVHCCSFGHMMHRCEMHCSQSCAHRCHINHCRSGEYNIASTGTTLSQPQIVIPLQNVSNDMLLQLISAVTKPQ